MEDEEDESGEEETEEGKDYSWKKTIMIGPSYQVRHQCHTMNIFPMFIPKKMIRKFYRKGL